MVYAGCRVDIVDLTSGGVLGTVEADLYLYSLSNVCYDKHTHDIWGGDNNGQIIRWRF